MNSNMSASNKGEDLEMQPPESESLDDDTHSVAKTETYQ